MLVSIVPFPTYFTLWKRDFPDLKVSRPVEDICKDCYAFANRHRYLANHTMGCGNDDGNGNGIGNGNGNGNGNSNGNGNGNGEGKCSNDRHSNDGNNNDDSNDFSDVGVCPMRNVDLNRWEAASTKVDKERELMLLQAAAHINWQGHREPSTRTRWWMWLQMQLQRKNTW